MTVAVIPDQRILRFPRGAWNAIDEEAAQALSAAADLEPLPPSELGLAAAPAATPPPASGAGAMDRSGGGVPWILVVAGLVVALGAVALVPPVRRRLSAGVGSS